jgi:hypothetical protein
MYRNEIPGRPQDIDNFPAQIYSALESTVITIGSCFTECYATCYAGFFYTKPSPKLLANQQVSQRLKECITLMESQNSDMITIRPALKNCHADVRAAHAENKMLMISYQSQWMVQQRQEFYDKNFENRMDMLDNLTDLLDTYPQLEAEDESSLDRLNVFYNERDKHHQEVLTLVEIYLPETYAALTEEKPVLKSLS